MSIVMPYTYEGCRLPSPSSIRLVTLMSSNFFAHIPCKMEVVELDVAPPYFAVSYVWGSLDDLATIHVFDSVCVSTLKVSKNLSAFLQRMQDTEKATRLWIDSICINQADTEERNEQVKNMGRIYRGADTVLIWLGEPEIEIELEVLERAVNCMDNIARNRQRWRPVLEGLGARPGSFSKIHPSVDRVINTTRPNIDEIHQMAGLPLLDSPEFKALEALSNHPWTTRAWTWQESFLAKRRRFYCGNWSWAGDLVRAAFSAVGYLRALNMKPRYERIYQGTIMMVSSIDALPSFGLFELLEMRRGSGCTYPSDMIYSLLGAAEQCPDIKVDYRSPFQEVFARAMFQFILQKGLGVLKEREDDALDRPDSSLPSWVPEWRAKPNAASAGISDHEGGNVQYHASGSSKISAFLSSDARILTLSGIRFDRISRCYHKSTIGGLRTLPLEMDKEISHLLDPEDIEDRYRFTGESFERAFRRIHFVDRASFTMDEETRWKPDSHEVFEGILDSAASGTNEDEIRLGVLLSALETRQRRSKVTFITESGRLGASPGDVRPGDVIAVLFGGEVLYVLRPCQDAGHYEFISECYVHGFMDGEALVSIRKEFQPDHDASDTAWLDQLHLGDMPLPVEMLQIQ